MVRTRSMTAVLRRKNLIKTKAAPPKSKRKAASPKSKRAAAQLKAAAAEEEEQKMMAAAERAVDVELILRLKKEAMDAMETECFPLTAKAKRAAAALKAKRAAKAGAAEEAKVDVVPEKKKETKTKFVKFLVSQGFIDHMKEAGPFHCVDEIPEEDLAKESPLFQEGYRASVLLTNKIQACQKALLDQYDAFGYAYDVKEVTDDKAEDDAEMVLEN